MMKITCMTYRLFALTLYLIREKWFEGDIFINIFSSALRACCPNHETVVAQGTVSYKVNTTSEKPIHSGHFFCF